MHAAGTNTDANYLETFLLTYNSFIGSVDLMKQLIKRYVAASRSPRATLLARAPAPTPLPLPDMPVVLGAGRGPHV